MSKHLSTEIRVPIDENNPSIIRIEEKCIKCGMCKTVCTDYLGVLGTYNLESTLDQAICIHCGQCANVCPTSAIAEKKSYHLVKEAVKNPDKKVIFNTSPSVRIALGEAFEMPFGSFVQGKMVALLRALGGDHVLDTNFSADLTIMEEASELISRVVTGEKPLPQFTSCCPAWVEYAEMYHPEILPNISTAKSPIGMQGPTVKSYFCKNMDIDPATVVNVAVTPCTAKKFEIEREEMKDSAVHLNQPDLRDMDYVITTRELAEWAKEEGIDFASLVDSAYDPFMGEASGGAVIFGNSGGVMEAAVRTAYEFITKEPAPQELYELTPVRGLASFKEATLKMGAYELNIAVIYGTKQLEDVLNQLMNGDKQYHFVEVMTCPGGCIGGGGQPKDNTYQGDVLRWKRIAGLYGQDQALENKVSCHNSEIQKLYEVFYDAPLSPLAEQMLHTSYSDMSDVFGVKSTLAVAEQAPEKPQESQGMAQYVCKICGYIHDDAAGVLWEDLGADWVCPLCKQPKSMFEKK